MRRFETTWSGHARGLMRSDTNISPMPIRFERDDADRRITVVYSGTFQLSDALAILERHRSENVATYAFLYDLRGLTGQPTIDDLRHILDARIVARHERARTYRTRGSGRRDLRESVYLCGARTGNAQCPCVS